MKTISPFLIALLAVIFGVWIMSIRVCRNSSDDRLVAQLRMLDPIDLSMACREVLDARVTLTNEWTEAWRINNVVYISYGSTQFNAVIPDAIQSIHPQVNHLMIYKDSVVIILRSVPRSAIVYSMIDDEVDNNSIPLADNLSVKLLGVDGDTPKRMGMPR